MSSLQMTKAIGQVNENYKGLVQLWQKVAIICAQLIQLGTYLLIARVLGPTSFGIYLFVCWLASLVVPVLGTGMSPLASRRVAEIQSYEPPRMLSGIFYFLWYRQHVCIFRYCLLYLLLAIPIATLLRICTPGQIILAGLAILPLLLSNIAGTTLRSLRRTDLLTLLRLFSMLLTLLLVLIATQIDGKPLEGFLLAFALSNTLTLILAVVCVVRLLPLKQALQPGIFLKERLQESLKPSWLLFLLDSLIWQHGEILFVARHYSITQMSFYTLSALLSVGLLGLTPSLFIQWVLPLCLRFLRNSRSSGPYEEFAKTTWALALLSVPLYIMLILFCPQLIHVLLGDAYSPLTSPLRILLIATAIGSIATASTTQLAQITRNQHIQKLNQINTTISLLKLLFLLPLLFYSNIVGIALLSATAQIISASTAMLLCRKQLLQRETYLSKERG